MKDTILDLEAFKKLDSFRVVVRNPDKNNSNSYEVRGYKFFIYGKKTFGSITISAGGSNLKVTNRYLEMLNEGDWVQFTDIRVRSEDGKICRIENFGGLVNSSKEIIYRRSRF